MLGKGPFTFFCLAFKEPLNLFTTRSIELHVPEGLSHRNFSGTEYPQSPTANCSPIRNQHLSAICLFPLPYSFFCIFHVMYNKLKRPMMMVNVKQVMIFVLEKAAIRTKKNER